MGLREKLSTLFAPRESAADRATWLDTAVRGAANQAQGRVLADLRQAQRSFQAAETPAWTNSWPTHAVSINHDLERQLPILRARSHDLARNNEWAIRYMLQLDDNVLGEQGIRLQMRCQNADGTQDNKTNDLIEGAWDRWGERADVSGRCWREIETLALAGLAQDGEILYRLRPGAGRFGFQIQLLDPALLDVTLRRDWQGRRVRMGIEIDDDGLPVAYWLSASRSGDSASDLISDFTTVGKHIRVPADQVRHAFVCREVGQLRGYPWLAGGARRLWLLQDFEEAAGVASSNAAKRQGFFVSPTGDAPPGFADTIISSVLESARSSGKVLTPDEIQAITSAAEKYATTVPGQFDTLPNGYDFRKFDSDWPNIDAASHVKAHLRGWTAARGMSYVTLGNDLESVNYSSAQVGIVGEREHFKTIQGQLKNWLHAEVISAVLPYLILRTPGLKSSKLDEYTAAVSWQPRRWQPVDPVKTANANETNLRLGLTSRRRIILERGDDPDEIAAEVEEELELYGPIAAPVGTPTAPTAADAADSADAADAEDAADAAAAAKAKHLARRRA